MAVRRRGWVRYRIVDWIVERTWALMGVLALACVLLVLGVTTLVMVVTPGEADGAGEWHVVWVNLLLTLDPGTIGNDNSEREFWYRVFSLTATVGGILLVSSLIGVLTAALNDKLLQLRRGRTPVVERRHTVVLGWSDEVDTILDELALEADGSRPCAVILDPDPRLPDLVEEVLTRLLTKARADLAHAPRDVPERRAELARKVTVLRKRLRVVYRIGDPIKIDDLELVSLETADAVIVPRPLGPSPDLRVLATLLAVNGREWPEGLRRPPLVAVISVDTNVDVAYAAVARWRNGVVAAAHIVEAEKVTSRVLAQSLRYPGVSIVCREMLSFEGIEVRQPDSSTIDRVLSRLVGRTYGQALHLFDRACLIGIQRGDEYLINPFSPAAADGILIEAGDKPILIAHDIGSQASRMGRGEDRWQESHIARAAPTTPPTPDRVLVLGWNSRIRTIVAELRDTVAPGSELFIVGPGYNDDDLPEDRGGLTVRGLVADASGPRELADLDADGALGQLEDFTRIVVLTEDDVAADEADAKALVTLLLLQQIKGEVPTRTIICELADDGNRRLARTIAADDLVVGQRLVSSLATQYAKNPDRVPLTHIAEKLLHARGEDICVKPAHHYVDVDAPGVTFGDVVEGARRQGQTAIGYRLARQQKDYYRNDGVHLNPAKNTKLHLTRHDEIIVIANYDHAGHDQQLTDSVASPVT